MVSDLKSSALNTGTILQEKMNQSLWQIHKSLIRYWCSDYIQVLQTPREIFYSFVGDVAPLKENLVSNQY